MTTSPFPCDSPAVRYLSIPKRYFRRYRPLVDRKEDAMPEAEAVGAERTIELTTADGLMPLYEVEPKGGESRRAVIVVQEAFGVNDYIEDVCRRFSLLGYHAVAPHLFHRSGGGTISYDRYDLVRPHFEQLSDDRVMVDVDSTIEHVSGAGFSAERTGVVGFCFGGRLSFQVACQRELGAAVGFYGGGILHGRSDSLGPLTAGIAEMRTPWLGLFGDRDQSIPPEEVEELRRLLEKAPVESEIVRYAEASHGFHCDRRDSYHEESASDAWERTLEWFDRYLA
jgi:carboxymethylenebutenolidase